MTSYYTSGPWTDRVQKRSGTTVILRLLWFDRRKIVRYTSSTQFLTNGKTCVCAASNSAKNGNRRDLCCSRRDYLVRVCSDGAPSVCYVRRPAIRLCESRRLGRPITATDLLGFYAYNSGQLAPAHHHFTHVGLPVVRTGSGRAPL